MMCTMRARPEKPGSLGPQRECMSDKREPARQDVVMTDQNVMFVSSAL